MNCPSRTDDLGWTPGWNQNPPFLAAELTTCQDLNGIVNARELKSRCRYDSRPAEESLDVENRASPSNAERDPSHSKLQGWAWWSISVFCTSLLFSNVHFFDLSNVFPLLSTTGKRMAESDQPNVRLTKRTSCSSGGVSRAAYNTPLHVGALFIILLVSTTGCAFPMLVLKFPRLRIPANFLFSARHFGTGVLIATAFVHLLPTAFISLGNPCLSSFWTTDYPAMPGAIALAAIFLLTVIEMVFSPGRSICSGGHGDIEAVARTPRAHRKKKKSNATQVPRGEIGRRNSRPLPTVVDGSSPLRDLGPLYGRTSSFSRTLARMGEENEGLVRVDMTTEVDTAAKRETECAVEDDDHDDSRQGVGLLTPEQLHKRAVLQCLLLEVGILFHSVFIGMSLSVSVGNEFLILLIAIIFHQTFEGLALGARIASLEWPKGAIQPWIMAFTYGCTTPLGQAIGLATHTLYSPDSEVGLLLVGIMNAISSGLLVFASLVELMSEDFLSDESWRILRGKRRVCACLLVFMGAFCMAFVGAWA